MIYQLKICSLLYSKTNCTLVKPTKSGTLLTDVFGLNVKTKQW